METVRTEVDIRSHAFWKGIVYGTRVGLTDLKSVVEEKEVAARMTAAGQTVTFDAKDAIAPYRVNRFIDMTPGANGMYSFIALARLDPENPGSEVKFLLMRSAQDEPLQMEIYTDKTVDIFQTGAGNREDLARLAVEFFEGLTVDSPPPLTGYPYANYIHNWSVNDAKGEHLEFQKFVELSGRTVDDRIYTLALYLTGQENDYATKFAIFEYGMYENEQGGSIMWLTGDQAADVDVLALA